MAGSGVRKPLAQPGVREVLKVGDRWGVGLPLLWSQDEKAALEFR